MSKLARREAEFAREAAEHEAAKSATPSAGKVNVVIGLEADFATATIVANVTFFTPYDAKGPEATILAIPAKEKNGRKYAARALVGLPKSLAGVSYSSHGAAGADQYLSGTFSEAESAELLVAIATSWQPKQKEIKGLVLTRESCPKLYGRLAHWLPQTAGPDDGPGLMGGTGFGGVD